MHIIRFMTTVAVGGDLHVFAADLMTGIALDFRVTIDQLKTCIPVMVKTHLLPIIQRAVAFEAITAVLALVDIIHFMTINTLHAKLMFKNIRGMTGTTFNCTMPPLQSKLGKRFMIIGYLFPTTGVMTSFALFRFWTVMDIIDQMAGNTSHWRIFIYLVGMTSIARCLLMLSGQREMRLTVVKIGILPAGFLMTIPAGIPQLTFMMVVFRVAAVTILGSLPEFLIFLMAGFTGET